MCLTTVAILLLLLCQGRALSHLKPENYTINLLELYWHNSTVQKNQEEMNAHTIFITINKNAKFEIKILIILTNESLF